MKKNSFEEKMVSKKLAVIRILRDHPNLRKIENRSMVWKLAKQHRPDLTMVDCDRLCRHIQNTKQLYQPIDDDRYNREQEYKEYYKPVYR